MRTTSTKAGSDSTIIEEFDSLLDIVYTSTNTLCDKVVSLLNYLTNFTTRSGITLFPAKAISYCSGVPDSQRTMYGSGLIADNKNQFYAKIKSLRDVGKYEWNAFFLMEMKRSRKKFRFKTECGILYK